MSLEKFDMVEHLGPQTTGGGTAFPLVSYDTFTPFVTDRLRLGFVLLRPLHCA